MLISRFIRSGRKVFLQPIHFIWNKVSSESYARHIGVNMGKDVHIMVMFDGVLNPGLSPLVIMFT